MLKKKKKNNIFQLTAITGSLLRECQKKLLIILKNKLNIFYFYELSDLIPTKNLKLMVLCD